MTGLSQTDFARSIGLKQNTYNSYETGSRKCSIQTAIDIRLIHGATLDYIYMGREDGLTVNRVRELAAAHVGK